MKRIFSPRKITSAAVLLALAIISTMIFKLVPMGNLFFLRFSLTPGIVMFASLVLGPFYGAVIGMASDLFPGLLASTGAYNPFLTLVYGLLGVLPWILEKFTKKFRSSLKPLYLFYSAMAVIYAVVVIILFATDFFVDVFKQNHEMARWIALGILFLVSVGSCIAVTYFNKGYEKDLLENSDLPSPNEIAIIVLISEFSLMCAMKSAAFYVFYLILGQGTPAFQFGLIFMTIFLGLGINVTISGVSLYWMLVFEKKHLRINEVGNNG